LLFFHIVEASEVDGAPGLRAVRVFFWLTFLPREWDFLTPLIPDHKRQPQKGMEFKSLTSIFDPKPLIDKLF